jgi:nitrite reductase (NADH) large subunit
MNIARSIAVDEHMKTNIDGIYAAGDVAEYNGKNFSIWPIAMSQGKIAGNNAAGGNLTYDEINPFTSLKIKGITMFSIGDVFSEDAEIISEFDEAASRYVKLLVKNDVITGAIVFGDSSLPMKIKKATEQKVKLPSNRSELSIKELIEGLK